METLILSFITNITFTTVCRILCYGNIFVRKLFFTNYNNVHIRKHEQLSLSYLKFISELTTFKIFYQNAQLLLAVICKAIAGTMFMSYY